MIRMPRPKVRRVESRNGKKRKTNAFLDKANALLIFAEVADRVDDEMAFLLRIFEEEPMETLNSEKPIIECQTPTKEEPRAMLSSG